MEKITEVGNQEVEITSTKILKMKNDGILLQLTGHTEDLKEASGNIYFNGTMIQTGPKAGMTNLDISTDLLVEIGMEREANGYVNIAKANDFLIGKHVIFDCQMDEYKGKSFLKVVFINAVREGMAEDEAAKAYNNLIASCGTKQPTKKVGPPPAYASGQRQMKQELSNVQKATAAAAKSDDGDGDDGIPF